MALVGIWRLASEGGPNLKTRPLPSGANSLRHQQLSGLNYQDEGAHGAGLRIFSGDAEQGGHPDGDNCPLADGSVEESPESDKPTTGTASLVERARSAVVWNTGFNIFRDVLQFAQMVFLTRLLDHAAYGMFAFSTSVVGIIAVFSATPFVSHALQVKSEAETHFQDHFTAGAVIQFVMFTIANLAAFVISQIPSYASAAPLVHVLSLTFLLEWPCEIRRVMIQRRFDFKSLRLLQSVGLIASTVTSILMAYAGMGAFALVVPGLLVTLPFTWDLLLQQKWRPLWSFSWSNYSPAFRFGLTRVGSGVTRTGSVLVETFVLTAMIGFGSLGVFNRAVGLANIVCMKTSAQLMAAVYPMLTRLETSSGAAQRAGNLIVRLIIWLMLPAATVLSILAEPVVHTVYGVEWHSVTPLLKWTLALSVATALVHVNYQLLLARNHSRICLACDLFSFLGSVAGLTFAIPFGVIAYLITQVTVNLLSLLLLVYFLLQAGALSGWGLCQALGPASLSSCLAAAISHQCVGPTQEFQKAILWGGCFSVVYAVSIRALFPGALYELIRLLPRSAQVSRLLMLPQKLLT
ncbi:MAG: oligosaccharide flippase family protein [Planctomycetaceae bacterium]|nr:oligosaccharide flippase family protein [Planctomycetaceae bacterium]